jgi:predicted nucleic acid-binding protein
MKTLIDTNVIMDVLMNREPFAQHSAEFMRLCGSGITGCITTNQTTDIFFLLCRQGKKEPEAKVIIKRLADNLSLIDVLAKDVHAAFDLSMDDFEDALIVQCAKRTKVDYIITRNEGDFINSPVPALSPLDFMVKFYPKEPND